MNDKNGIPIIPYKTKTKKSVTITCPYCKKIHRHGFDYWSGNKRFIHRGGHCTDIDLKRANCNRIDTFKGYSIDLANKQGLEIAYNFPWKKTEAEKPLRNGEYLVALKISSRFWYEIAHYNCYYKEFSKSNTDPTQILTPEYWSDILPSIEMEEGE